MTGWRREWRKKPCELTSGGRRKKPCVVCERTKKPPGRMSRGFLPCRNHREAGCNSWLSGLPKIHKFSLKEALTKKAGIPPEN